MRCSITPRAQIASRSAVILDAPDHRQASTDPVAVKAIAAPDQAHYPARMGVTYMAHPLRLAPFPFIDPATRAGFAPSRRAPTGTEVARHLRATGSSTASIGAGFGRDGDHARAPAAVHHSGHPACRRPPPPDESCRPVTTSARW